MFKDTLSFVKLAASIELQQNYLNKKRIEEAKEKFKSGDYRHLTIEAIGSSVGFRSKSAFYTAFKKHTGLSPAGYIKAKTSP